MNELIDLWISSGLLDSRVLLLKLFPRFFDLLYYLFLPLLHDLMDFFINLRLVVLNVELSNYINIWAILHDRSQILNPTGRSLVVVF